MRSVVRASPLVPLAVVGALAPGCFAPECEHLADCDPGFVCSAARECVVDPVTRGPSSGGPPRVIAGGGDAAGGEGEGEGEDTLDVPDPFDGTTGWSWDGAQPTCTEEPWAGLGHPLRDVLDAMDVDDAWLTTAPDAPDVHASMMGVRTTFGGYAPRSGPTMAMLTTGVVAADGAIPSDVDHCGDGVPGTSGDQVVVTMDLSVPPGKRSLRFDFAFFSREYPYYVGSPFNDRFEVFLAGSAYTGQIVFDEVGNPVTVNSAFFTVTGGGPLVNTGYAGRGGTGWLSTVAPVAPDEAITLRFELADVGDGIIDSLVLIDAVRFDDAPADAPATGQADGGPGFVDAGPADPDDGPVAPLAFFYVSPKTVDVAGGALLRVHGAGFAVGTRVYVGGFMASVVGTSDDGDELLVSAPTAASAGVPGGGPVAVEVVRGTESIARDDLLAYTTTRGAAAAAPLIAAIEPPLGDPEGMTTVRVVGTGLDRAERILFDGAPGTISRVDVGAGMMVVPPAHAEGIVDVVVVADDGAASAPIAFIYSAEAADDDEARGCAAVDAGGAAGAGALLALLRLRRVRRRRVDDAPPADRSRRSDGAGRPRRRRRARPDPASAATDGGSSPGRASGARCAGVRALVQGRAAALVVALATVAGCSEDAALGDAFRAPRAAARVDVGEGPQYTAVVAAGATVELDGSLSTAPAAPDAPLTYAWRIVQQPAGSGVQPVDASAARTRLVVDASGRWVAGLVVTDERGNASTEALVPIDVRDARRFTVRLAWSDPSFDLDLHVLRPDDGAFFDVAGGGDCFPWAPTPDWGEPGVDDDPRHVRDEDGAGGSPLFEEVVVAAPTDGDYRIIVHLFADHAVQRGGVGGAVAPTVTVTAPDGSAAPARDSPRPLVVGDAWIVGALQVPGRVLDVDDDVVDADAL